MRAKQELTKRILAGVVGMSLVASLIVAFVIAGGNPTVHIDGLELRMVADYETDEYGQYKYNNGNLIPVMDSNNPNVQAQSIQALVSVSISNVEYGKGVYVPLKFNTAYLSPSDWRTNGVIQKIPSTGALSDSNDVLHHMYFRADEDLYKYSETKADPFDWDVPTSALPGTAFSILDIKSNNSILGINLVLKRDLQEKGLVGRLDWKQFSGDDEVPMMESYIKFDSGKKTTLGTISFRLNDAKIGNTSIKDLEANLKELVKQFNGSTTGKNASGSDFLFETYTTGSEQLKLYNLYLNKDGNGDIRSATRWEIKNGIEYEIKVNSDDVLIKAEPINSPINDEVTINSYQAYTKGVASDLALAMQKYAETIRATYISGRQADMSMYWASPDTCVSMPPDGPGMFIQKLVNGTSTGEKYRLTWDSTKASGYRFEQLAYECASGHTHAANGRAYTSADLGVTTCDDPGCTGSLLVSVATPNKYIDADEGALGFQYDPKGGVYMISQYFTYMEKGGIPTGGGSSSSAVIRKAYPLPIEVKLTVTPIKLIDASVDDHTVTYKNTLITNTEPDGTPIVYAGLNLAEEAKLTLDTTLNGVIPTIPVAWNPSVLDSAVTTTAIGVGHASYPGPATAVWPLVQADFTAKTGIGDYPFTTTVSAAPIQTKYPWLTTSTFNSKSFTAHRIIIDDQNTGPSEPELASRYLLKVQPYEAPLGDEVGRIRFTITKQKADGSPESMGNGYMFRLFMPDGTEILVDPDFNTSQNQWFSSNKTATSSVTTWSDSTTGAEYSVIRTTPSAGIGAYEIEITPGKLGIQSGELYYSQRERLRRYINLGGWFGLQVYEPTKTAPVWNGNVLTDGVWTDLITDYSKPRTNIYIHDYTLNTGTTPTAVDKNLFDYTGNRVGLMPFYADSVLPKFITLPADDRVSTMYDAFSGAQPGTMRQFAVESGSPTTWDTVSGDKGHSAPTWTGPTSAGGDGEIVTYGADNFARIYEYSNYGRVVNPNTTGYSGYTLNTNHKVKMMVQVQGTTQPGPAPNTDLVLTYEQNAGDSITYTQYISGVNEVKRVTFDTKTVNYTYQQIVTLTLTNRGNTEIRGLHIDVPTLNSALGPYFTIISAPAVNLPAGASTTFQISYIPDLPIGTYENIDTTQPVNILYDNGGSKTFEAVIRISESKLHKVTIVVRPDEVGEGRIMGDAKLVTGVTVVSNADVYNGASATSTYEKGGLFWVITEPKDMYKLVTLNNQIQVFYYTDNNPTKSKVYLREYNPNRPTAKIGTTGALTTAYQATTGNERLFYWDNMPDYSITVYVDYYEPLVSKLRLSDLHAFAWENESEAVWNASATPPIWQESNPPSYEQDLHDVQKNNYTVIPFDKDKYEYIVVLDPIGSTPDDNKCGVSVTLRKLETHNNWEGVNKNKDITPNVHMELKDGPGITMGGYPNPVGDTDPNNGGPTTHHSQVFDAPTPKNSTQTVVPTKTLIITVSYDGTNTLNPPEDETVTYTVHFVRRIGPNDEAYHQLNAGNSPFGMIENESTFSTAKKAAAKADFIVKNRFRDPAYTPTQAQNVLTNIYWPEAWGWTLGKADDGVPTYETAANLAKVNYDRDETVLFVYLNEEFYDPGVTDIYNNAADLIDEVDVKRTLTNYYQMDTSKTTAMDRFTNGSSVTTSIDLGTVRASNGAIPGDKITVAGTQYSGSVSQFQSVGDIRPGLYRLTYTFKDFDGTTDLFFTRPLVVLSHNGDVNADGKLTNMTTGGVTGDADAIRKRFSTQLPMKASDFVASVNGTADSELYRYRIVDTNNDRNINNIDADLIRWVVTPAFTGKTKLTEFYRPTDYTNPIKPTP